MNNQLVNYLKDNLKKGYTVDELRNVLIRSGFKVSEINEAVENLSGKKDTEENDRNSETSKCTLIMEKVTIYKPENWEIIQQGKVRHSVVIGQFVDDGFKLRKLIEIEMYNKIKKGVYTLKESKIDGLLVLDMKGNIVGRI